MNLRHTKNGAIFWAPVRWYINRWFRHNTYIFICSGSDFGSFV